MSVAVRLALLLGIAALALVFALPAHAATAFVVEIEQQLTYQAGAGEANRVRVRLGDDGLHYVTDPGSTITPGTGCTAVSTHEVACDADPSSGMLAFLGDLDDFMSIAGVPPTTCCDELNVFGEDGDDLLVGSRGFDSLDGGAGADTLRGRGGPHGDCANCSPDGLFGGAGNDILYGEKGGDLLRGEGGDDVLNGGGSHDELEGGPGRDVLRGGRGTDSLAGGRGADMLSGGRGYDSALGGRGNDTFMMRDGFPDVVRGMRGFDRARIDRLLDVLRSIERLF